MGENLGLKVGSKDEAYWNQVRDNVMDDVFKAKHSIIINKKILELAEEELEKCQTQETSN